MYLTLALSISTAAATRISSLLAANNQDTAKLTARSTAIIGVLIATISSGITYLLCSFIVKLFTSDEDVRYRAVDMAPMAAAFQWAFSALGCLQGVLRGLGYQYFMAK